MADVALTPVIEGAMPSSIGKVNTDPVAKGFPSRSRSVRHGWWPTEPDNEAPKVLQLDVNVMVSPATPLLLPPVQLPRFTISNGWNLPVCETGSLNLNKTLFGSAVCAESVGDMPSDIGMFWRASMALDDGSDMAPEPEPASEPTSEPDVS